MTTETKSAAPSARGEAAPPDIDAARLAYANACERMGMAHATGARAEWEAAVRDEETTRRALNGAIRLALASAPVREEAAARAVRVKRIDADDPNPYDAEIWEGDVLVASVRVADDAEQIAAFLSRTPPTPYPAPSPSSAPTPDLAPWYEAGGSTVMLPVAEVERRRRLAAKVIEAARREHDPATSEIAYEDHRACPVCTALAALDKETR